MPATNFRLALQALASFFDWDRQATEDAVTKLEKQLCACSPQDRDEIRRQLVLVVSNLSRLEIRLAERYGRGDPSGPLIATHRH
jgi:hypothetical protein